MIQNILTHGGFGVECAFSASGAMDAIRKASPDLILLDIGLPDGSGLDVCRNLQSEPGASRIPVLFISSHEDLSTKVQGFNAGAVDYITKPVAGAEVIARVRTHLRLRQAYESLARLQAERIQSLAAAQGTIMPRPEDHPEARFGISLKQVLKAGGDFYDVIPIGDRIMDYVVADASGHDLAASFWTAALKALLAEYATPVNSPRDVMHAINSVLCRILPEGVFFTIIYARLNRLNRRLSLVNAGHPPAILIPREGEEAVIVLQEGDVAGVYADAAFDLRELTLGAGDRFFLYSDGLIALDGSRTNSIRSIADACLAWRTAPLESMVDSVARKATEGSAVEDDIVLLGVEV
jgi:sigma-B regulation protein RsbU (phosphoserine phosphatase)